MSQSHRRVEILKFIPMDNFRVHSDIFSGEPLPTHLDSETSQTADIFTGLDVSPGGEVSPEDDRDWYLEDISMATGGLDDLPAEYIIELPIGPFDQGYNHSCGACVGALLMEIHESLGFLGDSVGGGRVGDYSNETTTAAHSPGGSKISPKYRPRRLSSGFIYHHRVNYPSRGMFGRDVFRILKKIGIATEEKYPSSRQVEATPKPGASVYRSAESRRISGYAKVVTLATLQRAIYEIGPAYMLLPCWGKHQKFWKRAGDRDNARDSVRSTTRTPNTTGTYNIPTECHAVAVIGYNPRGFIIVSSWGDSWGRRGRALFPYDDWPIVREVWVPLRQPDGARKKQNFARVIRAPFSRAPNIIAGEPRIFGSCC